MTDKGHNPFSKYLGVALGAGLAVLLAGCNLFGVGSGRPGTGGDAAEETGPPPTATPLALAPTLPPSTPIPPTPTVTSPPGQVPTTQPSEQAQAPTPLPEPTRIAVTAPAPEAGQESSDSGPATPDRGSDAPGISITPQLGEPGDTVMVYGDGFKASVPVTLHWAEPDGETGPVYYEVETDDKGSFEVGLIVPPADRWPGGPPEERDILQLRAMAEELGPGNYYYADFTYIQRVGQTALVLTYANDDYGYTVSVPNGWKWSWEGEDTSDVRFESPTGTGGGFIRVLNEADVQAAIQTVMAEEFPGQGYTTGNMTAGAYPGTQVTADNGRVVQFIPASGRVYALSFANENGQFALSIAGSFRLD